MTARLPVPRIVATHAHALEQRARALAAGAGEDAGVEAGTLRVVAFRLRGTPCAVDLALVARAVVLATPLAVPLDGGTERAVAFVDERPVPVADLAGAATGSARGPVELGGSPALVVETAMGEVAVVVEGPLDLAEDRLLAAATADGGAAGPVRLAGRLAGGAALLDPDWLPIWAGEAVGS